MNSDSFLLKVLSEILSDSKKYVTSNIDEHFNLIFGDHDDTNLVLRVHRHLHTHLETMLGRKVSNKDLDFIKDKNKIFDNIADNANIAFPQLNKLHFSLSQSSEILQMPVIDNHSHAGDFEQKFNCQHGINLNVLMDIVELTTALSLLSPEEGRDLWNIYITSPRERVDQYLSLKKIDDRCKKSVDYFRSTSMWNMLVRGFKEIYPGILNEQDIADEMAKQRLLGLVPSYTQIFDKAKITAAFCQRDNLEPAWDPQRFKFLLRVDPFIEMKFHEPLFKIALDGQGLTEPPSSFDDYISFIDQTIHCFKEKGTAAVKIHCAYVRPIHFQYQSLDDAKRSFVEVYSQNKTAIELDQYCQPVELRKQQYPFQDFIVRYILDLSGKLDLPVQFHTGMGFLPGLELKNSSPLNLESIISDPALRKTKLILLHGGYPFLSEATALAREWSNVYLDISGLTFLFNSSLSNWLTECIEILPENKLLFGTDAFFPELYYVAAQNGRRQLAYAIETLIKNNSISARKATRIAEGVLYKNAQLLYEQIVF
jgi:hypothetical protein